MKYNPPIGGGANDPFVDGNPGTGVEGSSVPAAAVEYTQREIMAVIAAAAGLVPTNGDLTQLLEALKQIFGGNLTTLAANTALTAPQAGLILVNAAAGNVTLTLPAANLQSLLRFEFLRIDASANTVTIQAAGADNIDQAASFTLVGQNSYRNVKADGVSVWRTGSQSAAAPLTGHGQCQLQLVDATHIALVPFGGNAIKIGGVTYGIPAAGVTITNAGLAASTLYRAYLWNNAGVLTLELSATAHATDTTAGNIGNEIKAGDNSRTFVGLAYTNGASQFSDADGSRLVRSWFNRNGMKRSRTYFTGSPSTASTTVLELSTTIRNSFLLFAGEEVSFKGVGSVNVSVTGQNAETAIAFDGIVPETEGALYEGWAGSTTGNIAFEGVKDALAEGEHYATLVGVTSTANPGTGTWAGGNSVIAGATNPCCSLTIEVKAAA